jgi:hypothetical protein
VAAARLPPIVADHAVHAARKVAALAPRGSSMAGCEMVAALAVFVACKKLPVAMTRDDVLGMVASLGVDARLFKRNLLKLRGLGKKLGRTAAGRQPVVNAALVALQAVLGPGDYLGTVTAVHAALARAFVGMRDDSAAPVTAFLSVQAIDPRAASFTAIAAAARFRPASLYNAVKRVLGKVGVVVEGPMSRANLGAMLRSRIPLGGGGVKEVPVAAAAQPVEATPVEAADAGEIEAAPAPITIPRATPVITSITNIPSSRSIPIQATFRPRLAITVARGRAKRSSDRERGRERATRARARLARGLSSGSGPPCVIATGLGPPAPVALLAVIDGG